MMNEMKLSTLLVEDAGAPEIRNPYASGMRPIQGWFRKLFGRKA